MVGPDDQPLGCSDHTEGSSNVKLILVAFGGGVQFDLIQENLKYFLEIIQNKKSDFLEWTIIVLIAGEIAVSVYDMWSRGAITF